MDLQQTFRPTWKYWVKVWLPIIVAWLVLMVVGVQRNIGFPTFNRAISFSIFVSIVLIAAFFLERRGADGAMLVEVDPLTRLDQRTPLHQACAHGHTEVARILLQAGAEVNRGDLYDWTPIHIAARHGHAAIAKLLLEHGANAAVS